MKPRLLISACLLGEPCRYDGKSKPIPGISALRRYFRLIPVCPEQLGGLPTPRTPAERRGDAVVTADGRDVTAEYRRGAEAALALARGNACRLALLKQRSPSCGSGTVYDGSFTRTLLSGDGITAELLKRNGVRVFSEEELEALFSCSTDFVL